MWTILASITRRRADGYTETRHIPTFYLDENAQGILTEDVAIRVAQSILDPFTAQDVEIHVSAMKN